MTDVIGRSSKKGSSQNSAIDEEESKVDEDEFNDYDYDADYNRHLMQQADDFLQDRPLALTYEASESKDFVAKNKGEAAAYNPYRKPKYTDNLDMRERQRLQALLEDIDELKKEEGDGDTATQVSGVP